MYITVAQLSSELNLPVAWLKAKAREGRIPCLRVGRRLLFDAALVRAALAEVSKPRVTDPAGGVQAL